MKQTIVALLLVLSLMVSLTGCHKTVSEDVDSDILGKTTVDAGIDTDDDNDADDKDDKDDKDDADDKDTDEDADKEDADKDDADDNADADEAVLSAHYVGGTIRDEKDLLKKYTNYESYTLSKDEPVVKILILTDRTITDVELLELSLEDLDAEGEAAYDKKVLHNVDKVTKDRPLLVKLTFYGAIPHWGISYKDADGKRKTCLLTVSGKDGSLLLEDL